MICNSSFHCRRNAQGLVNAAEIVVHEVKRNRVSVVLNFLRECIGKPRKTADGLRVATADERHCGFTGGLRPLRTGLVHLLI